MHDWPAYFDGLAARMQQSVPLSRSGVLTRVTGMALEAQGIHEAVGGQCLVDSAQAGVSILTQVVGFRGETALLMPAGSIQGLTCGSRVRPVRYPDSFPWPDSSGATRPAGCHGPQLPTGIGLLGRVVDAQGQPIDGAGALADVVRRGIESVPLDAMQRQPVRAAMDVGVRSINALLTLGRGQRVGLFAGSGVGKSVLLAMMARYTKADVIVVGLIGERGREVREFIEDTLGPKGRERAVVVAAPADAPPLLRLQGAAYASAIAEQFREQGRHVLLLMDSLTRYAMAQREIALAVGEAPATRGYPPSCFAKLANLVERSGNGALGQGSITAVYTVLAEGDDQQDPVADSARSILDGHIVLSRKIAESGQYPAIDIGQSASRVMHNVVGKTQTECARRFRAILGQYQQSMDLIQIGAYVPGSDAAIDEAIAMRSGMQEFLRQDLDDAVSLTDSVSALEQLLNREA